MRCKTIACAIILQVFVTCKSGVLHVFLCVDMAVLRAKVPRSSVERRGRRSESGIFVILGILKCMGNRIS